MKRIVELAAPSRAGDLSKPEDRKELSRRVAEDNGRSQDGRRSGR